MKAKFGAIVVDGRGKIGGHVASKNRAGSYFRTKVTPVNPSTAAQANARNRLTGISQAWRGLTDAQRAAWNAAVSDFAQTDIFGDLRNPSGFNLYQKLNNNLINVGQAAIDVPPVPSAVDSFTSMSGAISEAGETVAITFADAIAAGMSVKVFATAPQSAGKSFVKSEYRQVAVLDDGDVSPYALGTEYIAKFGSVGAEGQKVFIKMVQVNETTGQAGAAIVDDVIVGA